MLKSVLILSVAALIWGQHGGISAFLLIDNGVIDMVHGLQVQYDDYHNIILFSNRTDCYIVEADDEYTWDHMIRNDNDLYQFTDAVWHKILTNTDVSYMTIREASQYHSSLEVWECQNKDLHKVAYYLPTIHPTGFHYSTTTP